MPPCVSLTECLALVHEASVPEWLSSLRRYTAARNRPACQNGSSVRERVPPSVCIELYSCVIRESANVSVFTTKWALNSAT